MVGFAKGKESKFMWKTLIIKTSNKPNLDQCLNHILGYVFWKFYVECPPITLKVCKKNYLL